MDPDTPSPAIVKYHQGTVNRPTGKLVRLVKKSEQVPTKGLLFDNMVITDRKYKRIYKNKAKTKKKLKLSRKLKLGKKKLKLG